MKNLFQFLFGSVRFDSWLTDVMIALPRVAFGVGAVGLGVIGLGAALLTTATKVSARNREREGAMF